MTGQTDDGDEPRPASEEAVRAALRALREGGEDASLALVLELVGASDRYAIPLLPGQAIAAVRARFAIARDVFNGGMDQVAWNHGHDAARGFATALREVGAIENADLLERLAGALERYRAAVTDEQSAADPVKHFLAYRKAVGGPFFGIPELDEELAEALLEFVIERAASLPDPDGPLPEKGS